jgi:hypothetical protein
MDLNSDSANANEDANIELFSPGTGYIFQERVTLDNIGSWNLTQTHPELQPNDDVEFIIEAPLDGDGFNVASTSGFIGYDAPHTHGPDPGITNFPNDTPSNVDVIIDGSTVATNIGSGTFETTVDITGELTQDAWNDIELTSDTLGHIQATISIDGYRQIGTQ